MVQTPEERKRKAKDRNLRNRYGVTLEQFEEILRQQGNICPVCEQGDKVFCLDHNHKTLEVRGVVCLNCNLRVIGGARDQDHKIVNAARYVTDYPARKVFPEGLFLEKNPPKKRRKVRRVTRSRRVS
jgi:DNA-directed RNA polymerase subunit RPC12/RpoP